MEKKYKFNVQNVQGLTGQKRDQIIATSDVPLVLFGPEALLHRFLLVSLRTALPAGWGQETLLPASVWGRGGVAGRRPPTQVKLPPTSSIVSPIQQSTVFWFCLLFVCLFESLLWSRPWLWSLFSGFLFNWHCAFWLGLSKSLKVFSFWKNTHKAHQTAMLILDLTHAHHVEEQIKAFVLFMEWVW